MVSEDELDWTQQQQPMKLRENVEEQYGKMREHAETYPYVWASYIFVYRGLALWTTYKWRKLRNTESRVRLLQERLWKLVEEEENVVAAASSSIHKTKRI